MYSRRGFCTRALKQSTLIALKWSIDFRRVYATMLEHWLGLSCQVALGGTFPPLPLFRG